MERLTPDGVRYQAVARGDTVPLPFSLRFFLPALLRDRLARWQITAWVSAAIFAAATGAWVGDDLGWEAGLAAGLIAAGLPAVAFSIRRPVLVDLPAMALTAVAVFLVDGHIDDGVRVAAAVALIMVAAATRETAPIFGAIWAWHPVLLVGLVVPAIWFFFDGHRKAVDPVQDQANRYIAAHPFEAARVYHVQSVRDKGAGIYGGAGLALAYVAPWGAGILALGAMSWPVFTALAVGYLQLAVATDEVRLYQWAALPVIAAAVTVVPVAWLPLVVVAHLVNPWRGPGI